MKKILLVAYHFPPQTGGGTQRPIKFSKYLPEFGYEPFILTTSAFGITEDEKQASSIKIQNKLKIYRANEFLSVINKKKNVSQKNVLSNAPVVSDKGLLGKIKKIVGEYLFIPDYKITWFPFALLKGLNIIRNENIDIIFTTSPPETSHLIGYFLKKLTSKMWIADFRDGWIFDPTKIFLKTNSFRRFIEKKLESIVVKNADIVISVVDNMTDDFLSRYNNYNKFYTITNGFDADEFKTVVPKTFDSNKFSIVHTGSFSLSKQNTNIKYFLSAISQIRNENNDIYRNIDLILVGQLAEKEVAMINEFGLNDITKIVGYVPHSEAIAYQKGADLLLLISPINEPSAVLGKTFEYLASKRPIFALAKNNVAEQLIKKLNAGFTVDPENENQIKSTLIELYYKHKNNQLNITINDEDLLPFDRRELTKKLVDVINKNIIRSER